METLIENGEESTGQIFAQFQKPQSIGDPVIVNRFLSNNTTEQIGIIDSYFDSEDNLVFTCIDRNGKTLFPPTPDYSLAEGRFELYAKQLTIKAIKEQSQRGQSYLDRVNELKSIRNTRGKDKEIER